MQPEEYKLLAKDLKLEVGQSLDLGTFDATTGKRKDDPPVAKGATAGVPITGRIVNLEGQPVAGVLVKVESVLVPKSDDLTPWIVGVKGGEPPWVAARAHRWGQERPRPDRTRGDNRQGRPFPARRVPS